ncbi:hypothetical protein AVEN_154782-1 [Araneus ventricosus]|uniref:CCHC-type domain-containing protein n=1 Tax=Araneus ventricosus TaxID=182803 RepID=A0A4Y2BT36_ARAVE|nr:hypothetical protein AVEN_154782-1 [Araneus ventricosus]
MRKGGQLLDTKHLVLTFHGSKVPESINAGYMKLAVWHYFPNPLRCFKCQRFGHSKASCRGTLTCARCAEAGHNSSGCIAPEKCTNCKGSHTSFSRSCPSWIFEKEVISEKVIKQVTYAEAKRNVKARSPTPGTSYATVVKKNVQSNSTQIVSVVLPSDSVSFQKSYIPTEPCPKSDECFIKAPSPNAHTNRISTQSEVSKCSSDSLDFSEFKSVSKKLKKDSKVNKDKQNASVGKVSDFHQTIKTSHRKVPNSLTTQDNNCTHQSALKPFATTKPNSVDTELLPMAVLPPLEKRLLQTRESDADADAEMRSSSFSEERIL